MAKIYELKVQIASLVTLFARFNSLLLISLFFLLYRIHLGLLSCLFALHKETVGRISIKLKPYFKQFHTYNRHIETKQRPFQKPDINSLNRDFVSCKGKRLKGFLWKVNKLLGYLKLSHSFWETKNLKFIVPYLLLFLRGMS